MCIILEVPVAPLHLRIQRECRLRKYANFPFLDLFHSYYYYRYFIVQFYLCSHSMILTGWLPLQTLRSSWLAGVHYGRAFTSLMQRSSTTSLGHIILISSVRISPSPPFHIHSIGLRIPDWSEFPVMLSPPFSLLSLLDMVVVAVIWVWVLCFALGTPILVLHRVDLWVECFPMFGPTNLLLKENNKQCYIPFLIKQTFALTRFPLPFSVSPCALINPSYHI